MPVAILSTASFDATTIDPLTVTLADAGVKVKGNGNAQASFQDVNGDNLLDLIVHIDTSALMLVATDTSADLDGDTFTGEARHRQRYGACSPVGPPSHDEQASSSWDWSKDPRERCC